MNLSDLTHISFLEDQDDTHLYKHYHSEIICQQHMSHHEYKYCRYEHMTFEETSFDNGYFMDTIFYKCDLSNVRFDTCMFRHVIFKDCKLVGTDFSDSVFDDVTMENCLCRYANFGFMKNKSVSFIDTNLESASFVEVQMNKTSFKDCILRRCEFHHSHLHNIDISSCDIEELLTTPQDIKGAIIDYTQAASLIYLLEVKVKQ